MFVTKKALPGGRSCAASEPTMALPLLESMVPAFTALAQTPAKRPLRFGAVYFPNGATMQALVPRRDEPGLRVQDDSQAARTVPQSGHLVRQPVAGRRQDRDRSRGEFCGLVERRGRQADRGGRHPRRRQHRSGDREADRSGHAASRRWRWRPRTSAVTSAAACPVTAAPT